VGVGAQVGVAAPQQPHGALERRVPEGVGVLLPPGQRAGLAVDLQHEVVLVPDLDLRRHEDAAGAADEAQQQVAVVVEAAARDEGGEVGADGLDLEAGHGGDQVLGVRADVADGARGAAARRVGAPLGLLRAGVLELRRQPALVVADDDLAHAPIAPSGRAPRLLDHRVAGVVVGDGEHHAAARRRGDQVVGLLAVCTSGLSDTTWMPASAKALATG
jgi:hypothetical protein